MTGNITVNEHSSIRIAGEKVMYFDPFRISEAEHDADIIFITHDHYDHFSPEDIAKVSRDNTVFAAPANMVSAFAKAGITEDRVTFMKPGGTAEICGISAEGVPAYNVMKPFHAKSKGNLGYVVTVGGKRIYVCGDTDNIPEIRNIRCDIICVPIGGTYTMNAKQAAELVNAVKPAEAIPVHYGSVVGTAKDADAFAKYVDASVKVSIKIS